jgi:putative membrane protein
LRNSFEQHRRIAKWTYPIWMYVSVTGVLVYMMLYRWFA